MVGSFEGPRRQQIGADGDEGRFVRQARQLARTLTQAPPSAGVLDEYPAGPTHVRNVRVISRTYGREVVLRPTLSGRIGGDAALLSLPSR
jgi:hypothetical protein